MNTQDLNSRRTPRRRFLQGLGASGILAASPTVAQEKWPKTPVRIIVPFAPGGSSDFIARLISKPLGEALGVPVVVENKTGGNGSIGAAAVAQASDHHAFLLSDLGSLATTPLVSKDLTYKPEELKGCTLLAYSPHLLVVPTNLPPNSVQELVAWSKNNRVNAASSGSGTPNHLGIAEIAQATGLRWQHVPYRGGAQAIQDTAAGVTQLCLNGMLATMPLVNNGRLKILGVSKRSRMALISKVPTIAEQGVNQYESGTYQGVVVPTTMPKAYVERLNQALVQIIRAPDIRARLTEAGAEVTTSTPTETTEWILKDRARWAGVIKTGGNQLEGNV